MGGSNFYVTLALALFCGSASASDPLRVSQSLWQQFNAADQSTLLQRFPTLELSPPDAIGVIAGVQAVNRSTPGSNAGAAIGGAVGGAAYIDHAFRGGGSNYSALTQIGAMLLGAAAGSMLDSKAQARFEFNYSVKTVDGQIRESRQASVDEFARPVGQCVLLPDLRPLAAASCSTDKVGLLRALTVMQAGPNQEGIGQSDQSAMVICRLAGIGSMTLSRSACNDMNGTQE